MFLNTLMVEKIAKSSGMIRVNCKKNLNCDNYCNVHNVPYLWALICILSGFEALINDSQGAYSAPHTPAEIYPGPSPDYVPGSALAIRIFFVFLVGNVVSN